MRFAWLRRWSGRRRNFPVAGCLIAAAGLGLAVAIDRLPAAERGLSAKPQGGERIDVVFASVPDNPISLAVPLTRRALGERAALRKAGRGAAGGTVHAEIDDDAVFGDGAADRQDDAAGGEVAAAGDLGDADAESEGEGDASADDESIRLPRPRPEAVRLADAGPADAGPDLIAKASLPASARPPRDTTDRPEPSVTQEPSITQENVAPEPAVAQDPAAAGQPASPEELPDLIAADALDPAPEDQAAVQTALAYSAPAVGDAAGSALAAAAEPSTASACLPIDGLADADGDFERNRAALAAPGFCAREERFKERRRDWTVQTVDSGRPGPVWAVMHDDEALSFDTAVWGLQTYGGRLVTVETGGQRNRDGVDPNRNFADARVGCEDLDDGGAPLFTGVLAAALAGRRPILALHNNAGGPVPTGGLGHVAMDNVPKSMRVIESPKPDGPLAGPHNLVLLAARDVNSPDVAERAKRLSMAGMNVVVEPVRAARSDCSLSNYAVLAGRTDYFNVTVGKGEGDRQRRMVAAVLSTERLAPPAKTAAR